jgi:hypothetical protein
LASTASVPELISPNYVPDFSLSRQSGTFVEELFELFVKDAPIFSLLGVAFPKEQRYNFEV